MEVERALRNVVCEGFDDSVILPPGAVMTGNHEMYKVFTPFKNAWLKRLREGMPECVAAPKVRSSGAIDPAPSITLNYPRQSFDTAHFPVEEKAAIAQLRQFCQNGAGEYEQQRDFPAVEGTSRLSASLATGGLSPRQCLHRLLAEQPQALDGGAGSVWLSELIWREFYRHLMTYYPSLCKHRPFIAWTDRVQWQSNPAHLKAWQEGKTGYPIVDAAMRQLNSTGWMHNRLRMITASFLVKDLLIDWREGERYFMSQLIDGDLAANNGGWQWAASTGTDAAPYFRIFNPTTQGEKFDREGEFIRQWLPELRDVPGKAVHEPWKWAEKTGVTLDYPQPIVDHKEARLRTLAAYEEARERSLIKRSERFIRHGAGLLRLQRQRAVSELKRLIQPNHQYQSYTRQCAPGNLIKYFNICIDGVVDRPGSIKRSLRCLIGNHARQIVRNRAGKQHINAG